MSKITHTRKTIKKSIGDILTDRDVSNDGGLFLTLGDNIYNIRTIGGVSFFSNNKGWNFMDYVYSNQYPVNRNNVIVEINDDSVIISIKILIRTGDEKHVKPYTTMLITKN
jgi:hypothetical protein